MRLAVVVALAALVGCSSGAEQADYLASGGASAPDAAGAQAGGASGADAGGAGGAAGAARGGAGGGAAAADAGTTGGSAGCYIPLSMISGEVTSASSDGDLSGINQQPSDQQNCRDIGMSLAQGVTEIVDGQPTGAAGWTETFFTIVPSGETCSVTLKYTQAVTVHGDTCTYDLSVTLTVPSK